MISGHMLTDSDLSMSRYHFFFSGGVRKNEIKVKNGMVMLVFHDIVFVYTVFFMKSSMDSLEIINVGLRPFS